MLLLSFRAHECRKYKIRFLPVYGTYNLKNKQYHTPWPPSPGTQWCVMYYVFVLWFLTVVENKKNTPGLVYESVETLSLNVPCWNVGASNASNMPSNAMLSLYYFCVQIHALLHFHTPSACCGGSNFFFFNSDCLIDIDIPGKVMHFLACKFELYKHQRSKLSLDKHENLMTFGTIGLGDIGLQFLRIEIIQSICIYS